MQKSAQKFLLPYGSISLNLSIEIEYEKEKLYSVAMVEYEAEKYSQSLIPNEILKNCQWNESNNLKNIRENSSHELPKQKTSLSKNIKSLILQEEEPLDNFAKHVFKQLDEYVIGKRTQFDIPLNPKGTPFQTAVWKALLEIPYGQTCSYKDIACAVNNEKASRAVGMANNKNPIAIIIPCHRVIGANGKLVGYEGGVHLKVALLDIEKQDTLK